MFIRHDAIKIGNSQARQELNWLYIHIANTSRVSSALLWPCICLHFGTITSKCSSALPSRLVLEQNNDKVVRSRARISVIVHSFYTNAKEQRVGRGVERRLFSLVL